MQAVLRGHEKKRNELSVAVGKLDSESAIGALNTQITQLSTDITMLGEDIDRHKRSLTKSKLPLLTPEEFEARIR